MDDNWVPIVAMTMLFGAPCAVWCVSRVLAHHERMEMLRQGFVPPPQPHGMFRTIGRGWNHGWTPGPQQSGPHQQGYVDPHAQQQLHRGVRIAFIGLALLIGLGFIGFRGDGTIEPGPWLLGGLIPLFVGLAQVASAVLSGASIGAFAGRRGCGPATYDASSPSAENPAPGAAPQPTYGGWRPGPLPEIEKPASPPDYRS